MADVPPGVQGREAGGRQDKAERVSRSHGKRSETEAGGGTQCRCVCIQLWDTEPG